MNRYIQTCSGLTTYPCMLYATMVTCPLCRKCRSFHVTLWACPPPDLPASNCAKLMVCVCVREGEGEYVAMAPQRPYGVLVGGDPL